MMMMICVVVMVLVCVVMCEECVVFVRWGCKLREVFRCGEENDVILGGV